MLDLPAEIDLIEPATVDRVVREGVGRLEIKAIAGRKLIEDKLTDNDRLVPDASEEMIDNIPGFVSKVGGQ